MPGQGLFCSFCSALAVALLLCLSPLDAVADSSTTALSLPQQTVVLTVKGNIKNTNNGQVADFDMTMLKALPPSTIATQTPWTEGMVHFKGVKLTDILAHVASKGTAGEFTALNDYTVRIPFQHLDKDGPIIAYEMNGKPMSRRTKGPLWIVYPLDDITLMQGSLYRDRMVWQLRTITVM